MGQKSPLVETLRKIHRDERGAVSFETILIIAAIALPILIFVIKVGWPRIRNLWNQGMTDLEGAQSGAQGPGAGGLSGGTSGS
jgi:Flp pilus assembly pilin Flp